MASVQDVRDYLNQQVARSLPDASITIHLKMAEEIIEKERKEGIPQQTVDLATIAWAGYLSYMPYAAEMERGLGVIPPNVQSNINNLLAIAERFLAYVKGEIPIPKDAITAETVSVTKLGFVGDKTDTMWAYRDDDTYASD